MRCKVCLKIVRHPAKKTKVLQVCGHCQKNQTLNYMCHDILHNL